MKSGFWESEVQRPKSEVRISVAGSPDMLAFQQDIGFEETSNLLKQ